MLWYKPANTLVPVGMELIAGFPMSKTMKHTQSVTLETGIDQVKDQHEFARTSTVATC